MAPLPRGGGTDLNVRLLSEKLRTAADRALIVDNGTGVGGNIGMDAVAKSKPDVCSVGMGQTNILAINPSR